MQRRDFLAVAPLAAVAAGGRFGDQFGGSQRGGSGPGPAAEQFNGGTRVRMADVRSVRATFAEFQHLDVMRGGGAGQHVLARYVGGHVHALLRSPQTTVVRRALSEAAAEQTYLLGWMAYDNGEHGTAQRYLIQALRLAEESGNAALGAHVLAGMADQATLLGNPSEGRSLAQAGRHGLGRAASPACLADLWCLEARALAKLGDRRAASHAVEASQTAFERVRPTAEQEWAQFIDAAYLHGEYAHTFRDLADPAKAETHAQESIRAAKRQHRARRGALSQAALATTHLQRRDLESAHAAGVRAIGLAKRVKSSRCVEAVRDVRRGMAPFGAHRLVVDFAERSREIQAA